MRRDERHFKDEQVEEIISKALKLLDKLDEEYFDISNTELRVAVFLKATELFSAKQIFFEQIQPAGVILGG